MLKSFPILVPTVAIALLTSCSQGTKPPDCNESSDLTIAGQAIPSDFVKNLSATLGPTPDVNENRVREAVQQARSSFPKATPAEIIDLLASAYCPSIDPGGILNREPQRSIQSNFVDNVDAIISGGPAI
jgi:hypothetical protein